MLTKKDIVIIGDLIRDNNVLIKGYMDQQATDIKRDIRDEMHSVVNAAVTGSETRMIAKIEEVRSELHEFRREVTDLIGEHILPQIDAVQQEAAEVREEIALVKQFVGMPVAVGA